MTRPDRDEAADYYWTYINQVVGDDVLAILERQLDEVPSLFGSISEEQSLHRYAPGKWTIREVLGHVNDTERVFAFRAFWFARGFEAPLPSLYQDIAVPTSGADTRSLASHIDEFRAIRGATLSLLRSLPLNGWMRRGTASGYAFTPRALAFITAGHVTHHATLVRQRYLTS
jgi:DinB superfamily